jgi:hypothetical protein
MLCLPACLYQGVRSSLPQLSAAVQQSLAQAAQALGQSSLADSKPDSAAAGERSSVAASDANHVEEPGTPEQSSSTAAEAAGQQGQGQQQEQTANDSTQAVSDSSTVDAGTAALSSPKLKQTSMATPADMLWPGPPPDMAGQTPEANGTSTSGAAGQTSSSGAAGEGEAACSGTQGAGCNMRMMQASQSRMSC